MRFFPMQTRCFEFTKIAYKPGAEAGLIKARIVAQIPCSISSLAVLVASLLVHASQK